MHTDLQQKELYLTHTLQTYQKMATLIEEAHRYSEPVHELERKLVTEVMNLGPCWLMGWFNR